MARLVRIGWTPLIDFPTISVDAGAMYAIVLYADGYTGAVSVGAAADPIYAIPTAVATHGAYLDQQLMEVL